MRIATLVVGGSAAPNAFDDCPNTRPTHIMKWYREGERGASEVNWSTVHQLRSSQVATEFNWHTCASSGINCVT